MYVDIAIPPGLIGNGTARQARGRFRDMNLARWTAADGNTQPIGGWQVHVAATAALTGKCRAILPWKDNTGLRWIGLATHSHWYVETASGTLSDITPAGFTAGRADATTGSGYGTGAYGSGTFGTPRPDTGTINAATVATQDLWNDRLVSCWEEDGKLYEWDLNPASVGTVIANAPTGCMATVVTAEAFQFALKYRTIYWCDQGDNTVWTPSATNQAGSFDLITPGVLMCGRKVRGKTLVFTSVDVWEAVYENATIVYGFTKAGGDCGPVSKGSPIALDDVCYWMGREGFFQYNGAVNQIDCDVRDRVFTNINNQQLSKVSGWHNAPKGEIWWHYPSATATENDSYVFFNYRLDVWGCGTLVRLCGATPGVFQFPLLVGDDGLVYDHENGASYGGATPFVRTGPLEWPGPLGQGDQRTLISNFVGDLSGDVALDLVATLTLYGKDTPDGPEAAYGPYPIQTGRTDILVNARLVELKISIIGDASSRVGINSLDAKPLSKR